MQAVIPATGEHVYGDWVVTTPNSCGQFGEEKRECTCGTAETRPIAPTGNHNSIVGEYTPATCTTDGKRTYLCICGMYTVETITAKGHSSEGVTATCTEDGFCANGCGTVVIAMLSHHYVGGVCEYCGDANIDITGTYYSKDEIGRAHV